MVLKFPEEWPYFFTANVLDWKEIFEADANKQVIDDSLKFLVDDKRIKLFAFVFMNTHIHIVWQLLSGFIKVQIQDQFMKFTAQQLKFSLPENDPEFLNVFFEDKKDRKILTLVKKFIICRTVH